MHCQKLIEVLEKNKRVSSSDEISLFDDALKKLLEWEIEKNDLIKLFSIFDDECQDEEVLFGLVHLLEDLDINEFISAFIQAVPRMQTRTSEWIKTFHYRILNSEEARNLFKVKLKQAEPNRTYL